MKLDTLGLLEFLFPSEQLLNDGMGLMMELTGQIGLRTPYRRFLELTRETVADLREPGGPDWESLAEKIACLLSESSCAIWLFDHVAETFTRCICVGATLGTPTCERGDDSANFLCEVIESRSGITVDLLSNPGGRRAKARGELLDQGFRHGIAVSTRQPEENLSLVLELWSKCSHSREHFNQDDREILGVLSATILQVTCIHRLVDAQKAIYRNLLGGLGHELRAPLAALYDALDSIELPHNDYTIKDMQGVLLYTQELVSGLYTFARLQGLTHVAEPASEERVEWVHLFEQVIYPIRSVMSFWLNGKGLSMDVRFDPQAFPWSIRLTKGEVRYLRHVFFNLFDNAMKYTPDNEKRPILVRGQSTSEGTTIRVSNFGIGVPEGEEHLIFEREKRGSNASQTNVVGTGMGLSICVALLQEIGGEIALARSHNPTEFVVRLPRSLTAA